MTVRPKYIATADFRCARRSFVAGDEVTDPIVLDAVLRFGDRFVTTDTARARKGSTADATPAEAQTTSTPKEA